MTNKQAIETIKMAIAEVEWNYPMEYAIAFEKAVKSLEKDRKKAKYYKRKYLKERNKTMTKQQAIDFCIDRNQMHLNCADKIAKEYDIIENEIERIKYNNRIDLANKYKEIADLLEKVTD